MTGRLQIIIRSANQKDLGEITAIYNEAILYSNATFDTKQKTLQEQRQWFNEHGSKNPILVAEYNHSIIGWAALSHYSDRCAYSDTAEISVYVHKKFQHKGIGRNLLQSVIKEGKTVGLHTLIARITEGNTESVHLLESLGFEHIGIMREVGLKFGKRLDVYLMQKLYNSPKK
jgi:phosphinothricin acetyltransferase